MEQLQTIKDQLLRHQNIRYDCQLQIQELQRKICNLNKVCDIQTYMIKQLSQRLVQEKGKKSTSGVCDHQSLSFIATPICRSQSR